MLTEAVSIPRRFNGPPRSGNGGYVCGRLARYLSGPVSVRLQVPPPLEQELKVQASDDEARLYDGDTVVAHARRTELKIDPPAAPTFAEAEVASRSYAGFVSHPLPTCFVCGPLRAHGDGMRIFPGRTSDESVLAAPWIPHSSLADNSGRIPVEFIWAALDCAGAFTIHTPAEEMILLGELCARVDGSVSVGERCVVIAWPLGIEGRKRFAGTAIVSASGATVAAARATWIAIPRLPADGSPSHRP